MIEIPESRTVARQVAASLAGRTVMTVFLATQPHRFTWHAGDPLRYPKLLTGKRILTAAGFGPFVDIFLEDDTHLAVSDGANLRWLGAESPIPAKYQLLLTLDDETFVVVTVAMYGAVGAFRGVWSNAYYEGAVAKPSPLDEEFDADFFDRMFAGAKPNLSAKAFLATEQRIPGLGNGVLQDILLRAGIHPRRRIATLDDPLRERLYEAVRGTLAAMTDAGGRNTEKDLFGRPGGYRVLLSKNTLGDPCPECGCEIVREAYLGGTVYYCPRCQSL